MLYNDDPEEMLKVADIIAHALLLICTSSFSLAFVHIVNALVDNENFQWISTFKFISIYMFWAFFCFLLFCRVR